MKHEQFYDEFPQVWLELVFLSKNPSIEKMGQDLISDIFQTHDAERRTGIMKQ